MRKNIISFLLILFSPLGVLAQGDYKVRIDYDMILNFGTPITYAGKLHINDGAALFTYQGQKGEDIFHEEDNGSEIGFSIYKSSSQVFFVKTEEVMTSVSKAWGEQSEFYIIEEEIPAIEWVQVPEYKTIDGYECAKATCHFRGRDYVAWYSPEIPIRFGPYKFHGLPGLIFELSDSTEEVSFRLIKATRENHQVSDDEFNQKYPHISRKEYQEKTNKYFEDFKSKLTSRADRNFSVSVSSLNIKQIEM